MHELFKQYFSFGIQFAVFDKQNSSVKQLKCGVPQGSVKRPVLIFTLYD